jgi:MGT family glycosyltransferase
MTTVLVFSTPWFGHVHPSLPIVAELVQRGDRVIYYCSEPFRAQIEATGAQFRLLPHDFGPFLAIDNPRCCEMAVEFQRCSERVMPQLVSELKELAPSYVFSDFLAWWGRYAAQAVGIPLALLATSIVSLHYLYPPYWKASAKDVGFSLRRARLFMEMHSISKRLSRRYGVSRMRLPFEMLDTEADLVISVTGKMFQPHPETLDEERFHFVGACFEQRAGDQGHILPPLDDRPLIYVSLGTLFNSDHTFYRNSVEAFADGKYQAIISLGKRYEPGTLGTVPPNVHILKYVPQLEILKRAALFISHGGMNSVNESLVNGVPLLLAPLRADQPHISRRVESLGAGRRLLERDAAGIRRAVDAAMADPSLRERTRELGRALLEAGGPRRAADLLQAFGAQKYPTPRAAVG